MSSKKARARRQKQATKRGRARNVPTGGKRARIPKQNILQQTPAWSIEVLDIEGPWGWNNDRVKSELWTEIVPKLQNFETMTWGEINHASGGRRQGNNHHSIRVMELTSEAQKRLLDIKQDDTAEIFSFRLTGRTRIYGIRDGRVLKLLWYDPFHGDNRKAVVPVRRK